MDVTEADLKRTVRTTNMMWGYKLALSVRNPFFDARLADAAFSKASTDIQDEAQWQEVNAHVCISEGEVKSRHASVAGYGMGGTLFSAPLESSQVTPVGN